MTEKGKKRLMTAMKVIFIISLIPWVFMLCAAIYSFFAGATVGLFEAAKDYYGIEAFFFTAIMYLFAFPPVYLVTAVTAVVSAVILIVLRKKGRSREKSPAKVIMTCGRICSGKSTYAKKLRTELGAVILSVDEITLALFGQNTGEKHDEYVEKLEAYLFEKSVEIIETGTNVVLDWGFWTKAERDYARRFYSERGIACELHYINVSDEEWDRRIEKRNADITAGKSDNYYVDDGLKAKFGAIFEPPEENEADKVVNT